MSSTSTFPTSAARMNTSKRPLLTSGGTMETTTATVTETIQVSETVSPTVMTSMDQDNTKTSCWNFLSRGWIFWVLIVVAIIVGIVCCFLAGTTDATSYWGSLTKVSWADNLWVLAIFMFIALILLAWATWAAVASSNMMGNTFNSVMLYVTFGLQLLFTLVGFAFLFRNKQPYIAFFFILGILLVSAWQFFLMFNSGSRTSLWIFLIYVIWVLVLAFITWNVYSSN